MVKRPLAGQKEGPMGAKSYEVRPGMRVRCAYRLGHVGEILDIRDPASWEGSIAFTSRVPTRAAVVAHVDRCLADGLLRYTVPVRYTFGVMWDARDALTVVGTYAVIMNGHTYSACETYRGSYAACDRIAALAAEHERDVEIRFVSSDPPDPDPFVVRLAAALSAP